MEAFRARRFGFEAFDQHALQPFVHGQAVDSTDQPPAGHRPARLLQVPVFFDGARQDSAF
jgi:hypothetical protein